MNVLIDTSVWSLALRRTSQAIHPCALELAELIREDRIVMTGVVRQELLSGIRDSGQFAILRDRLRAFPDLNGQTEDFERAAEFYNKCRAKGIQGSTNDFLICAIAVRYDLSVFTTDADFAQYARILPLHLHELRDSTAL